MVAKRTAIPVKAVKNAILVKAVKNAIPVIAVKNAVATNTTATVMIVAKKRHFSIVIVITKRNVFVGAKRQPYFVKDRMIQADWLKDQSAFFN